MSMFLAGSGSDILTAILAIFTAVGEWFVTALPKLTAIFYVAETGLTFFGVMAVAGLAISVIFLLFGVVQKFLHFRG